MKLYSDSKHVCDAVEKGWARSWKPRAGEEATRAPKTPDLWERLLELLDTHEVEMIWVRGHADNPTTTAATSLLVMESKKFAS